MIKVEKLTYGFPAKDLYNEISFNIEAGSHCVLIGSNGTGKSTLVDLIIDPEKYLFDGKITKADECRIGYASQFCFREKLRNCTVFEYLSERFLENEMEIAKACEEMADAKDMEKAFERYQNLLDIGEAMDIDNYESNIRKQLYIAGMKDLENTQIDKISGGEYKLIQIMREMLTSPNLLILDEPDVFLDFGNLAGLTQLINSYKGTLLVITHNRYLLNHCFSKVLHLENGDIQEFEGTYAQYRCTILREKLKLKIQSIEEEEEIERTQEMVNILRKRATDMVNPVIGQSVNAKQSQLDRLRARKIKAPFIEIREPEIVLPQVESLQTKIAGTGVSEPQGTGAENTEPQVTQMDASQMDAAKLDASRLDAARLDAAEPEIARLNQDEDKDKEASQEPKTVLRVENYSVSFDEHLLENVEFEIKEGEKVAVVGENGTGKTTLIKDIIENNNPAIQIAEGVKYACLSQLISSIESDSKTVYELMLDAGFNTRLDAATYLSKYCMEKDILDEKVQNLSGGEQNMLQIALIGLSDAELLILDEPTSHLDIYGQSALEKAISEYKGTVLMVSHDFYLVAGCADYVFMVEENTVRRMRTRKFRKMVYDKYFDQKYLEVDRKKQELEAQISLAFKNENFGSVDKLCTQLEEISL